MKKPFLICVLLAALCGLSATASAEDAVAVAETVAAAAPVPDKGDTTWMMLSTLLVILMIVPGLSLFYGGLVRAKNMLSVLSQVFAIFALVSVLWVIYGYTLAFGDGGSMNWMIGDLSKLFLAGVTPDSTAATFTDGVVIPEFTFVAFQLTFAAITTALIVGGFAERIKFSALLVFSALWFTFSYLPIAHMVWATGGFLFEKGALDFAGGTVVHINAGIAALVGAIVIGKRIGYGKEAMAPHNLPMTMIGASLLWVGWFGWPCSTPSSRRARRHWPGCSPNGSCTANLRCWASPRAPSPAWLRSHLPPAWSARWARSSSAPSPDRPACGRYPG